MPAHPLQIVDADQPFAHRQKGQRLQLGRMVGRRRQILQERKSLLADALEQGGGVGLEGLDRGVRADVAERDPVLQNGVFQRIQRIPAEQRNIGVGIERDAVLVPRPAQDRILAIGLADAPFAAQAQHLGLGRGQKPLDLLFDQGS